MKTFEQFVNEGKKINNSLSGDNLSKELSDLIEKYNIDGSIEDINKWLKIFKKWLEISKTKSVLKDGEDAMKYFDPSIGEINIYFSEEDKEEDVKRWKHNIELLKELKKPMVFKNESWDTETFGAKLGNVEIEAKVKNLVNFVKNNDYPIKEYDVKDLYKIGGYHDLEEFYWKNNGKEKKLKNMSEKEKKEKKMRLRRI